MALKNYTILGKLGQGSFGTIYKARKKATGEVVTLKIIPSSDPDLLRETESLRSLSCIPECNPYVVCLQEYFYDGEQFILVMEFVPGYSLKTVMDRHLPFDVRKVACQLIAGLAYIHHAGYAHRDIKDQNVLLTPDGQIKYVDFGFACATATASVELRCQGCVGTIAYLAPEFFDICKDKMSIQQVQAMDIWALGVLLYQLVNGYYPFKSIGTVQEVTARIRRGEIAKSVSGVADLDPIINAALTVDHAHRPSIDILVARCAQQLLFL